MDSDSGRLSIQEPKCTVFQDTIPGDRNHGRDAIAQPQNKNREFFKIIKQTPKPYIDKLMSDSNLESVIHTPETLLQAYKTGQRNFEGVTLTAAQLSQANLKGANFSYADLSRADLSSTNLRGADLSYANLREANLAGADLRGSMLIGTDLHQANLEEANLEAADYDPKATHFPAGFDPAQSGMRADR